MKNIFLKFLPAFLIIAADQLTKAVVMGRIETGHVTVAPFFNLVLVWNKGISFGLFNAHSDFGPYLLIALSLVISVFFAVWLLRADNRPLYISISIIIGGAIGNVIDRLRFGAVVDFLDFHAFGWHWPAFNIADSAICVGIAFIVLDGLFFEPRRRG